MSYWQPYLIAIVIGLLVGLEREKAHPNQKVFGVRTFLLISLLGVLAGGLQSTFVAVLFTAFALSLILISYFTLTYSTNQDIDRGLTTEFAAGIVFALGFAAHEAPTLSAVIGPIVAIVLFSKKSLHRFSQVIEPAELKSALLLILGAVIIVNIVPDKLVDPWGIFNPKKFGFLILTLALLEFSSYVLAKILDEKKSALIVGFFGGLVSSTAVFFSSVRQARRTPENWKILLSSTLVAKLASLLELFLIVGLISSKLLFKIILPLSFSFLIGLAALIIIGVKQDGEPSVVKLKSPLDWRGVFRLSIFLAVILAAVSMAKLFFGNYGSLALSFVTGLFELQGISLANATMYTQGGLTIEIASIGIILAVLASLLIKVFFSWVITPNTYTRVLSIIFLAMAMVIVFVTWLSL